jgi:A/G-specific adenine glycosylase
LNYAFLSRKGIGSNRSGAPARGATQRATSRRLLRWFDGHRRPLPWRRDRDPYRIWVAEILLQQTRVAQAAPYFERFVARFPTVESLARADQGAVLKLWEGAGYYGRARRLHAAARAIVARHGSHLPKTPAALAELPGVGPYVAAAVASLAFDAPVVALEANGLRVAARLTLERQDPRRPVVRRRLARALAAYLPPERPGAFNEAIMELGETICRPISPACPACPLRSECRAFRQLAEPGSIPRARPRTRRPLVVAAMVAVERGGRWLVRRRPPDGLLGGLWEFPGGKPLPNESLSAAARRELREEAGVTVWDLVRVGVVTHAYSHFAVELHVFRGRAIGRPRPERTDAPVRWVTPRAFRRLPRPKATIKALRLLETTGGASRGSGSRRDRTGA